MAKTWQERITETIDFIEAAAVPNHADKRRAIAARLRHLNQQGLITQATSDGMSQGVNTAIRHRDAAALARSYRRALILIQSQLLGQAVAQAAQTAAAIGDGAMAITVANALGMAYQTAQQPLIVAYQALLANPGAFLAANKVQLFSAPTSGTVMHGFYYSAHGDRYGIKPVDATLVDEVYISRNICNIHVQLFSAIQGNLGAVVGHQVAHADLVITTQLTGCSVIFERGPAGLTLMAAHIQPTGATGSAGRGYNLVTSLRGNVGFAHGLAGGNIDVFGASAAAAVNNYDPGSAPGRHTFWLGVRTAANGWELHCQRHNVGNAADPGVSWRIV